jgi:hypothetical protein
MAWCSEKVQGLYFYRTNKVLFRTVRIEMALYAILPINIGLYAILRIKKVCDKAL